MQCHVVLSELSQGHTTVSHNSLDDLVMHTLRAVKDTGYSCVETVHILQFYVHIVSNNHVIMNQLVRIAIVCRVGRRLAGVPGPPTPRKSSHHQRRSTQGMKTRTDRFCSGKLCCNVWLSFGEKFHLCRPRPKV